MTLKVVPPKESITPRRKQVFYDFSNQVFDYGNKLYLFIESPEFDSLSQAEKESIGEEFKLIEDLNEFQVSQIENW